MEKIKNSFNQNVYTFKTKSGLKVIGVHKPGFKKSAAYYATPFGALNLKQKVNGEVITHKSGVAHFLEHKLFEDEKKDVLAQFSDLGASGNAFTSYDQTVYYFAHNGDIKAPLKLLLSFVSKFEVSAQSVEKEKGIIVEEIKMYEQMPHMKLLNETYRNLFHTYPFIYDIAGTESSVNATTVDDLHQAFKLNYNDSRMVLVVVSAELPDVIEALVHEAVRDHDAQNVVVEDVFDDEPDDVVFASRILEENLEASKMSFSYKIPYHGNQKQKDEFLVSMLLEMNFTELNPEYQAWLDDGIILSTFEYGVDFRDTFAMISFYNEGDNTEGFAALIASKMDDLNVSSHLFDLLSRRYYGEMIASLDSVEGLTNMISRCYLAGFDYFEYLEMIKTITYDDLLLSIKVLKGKQSSLLYLKRITA